MIDAQSSNASATIYRQTDPDDGDDWDPYGDEQDDWEAIHEDVQARYEPRGSAFVTESSGDTAYREERLMIPMRYHGDVPESTRIVIDYREKSLTRRVVDSRPRTIDGVEGFCELELEDWGDQ